MRTVIAAACAALLAAAAARGAEPIIRCESADGKVTYSNGECPPNTRPVRRVELSPPIVVHDGAQPPAKSSAPKAAPAIAPAPPRRARDPVQEDRELTAQLAEQRRECEARARDVQRLQDELAAASADTRASAELALRRAQDDFRGLCPRPR